MSSPPVLALPNFNMPFTIETDASGSGLGEVLMQQGKPLAFYSKVLGPKAAAQSIYEKEGMAILEALRKWRHYFLGNKLIIKTDQRSLKYLSSQHLLEGIQHELMLKLLEFDYTIEYKQGKENLVADALSRKHKNTQEESCLAISTDVPSWITEVEKSYANDEKYTAIIQELAIKPASVPHYSLQSGILRYKNRICIGSSTDLKERLFSSFHSSAMGGHSGGRVTLHRLKQLFHWPHMKKYIADQVTQCPVCQISKTERVPYPGLLDPLHIPNIKWSEISMDFVEGLPMSKGKNVILVVVDRLTKYAHFIPLAHPFTAHQVASLFIDNIFKLQGPPQVIISDRDRIFTSKIWQEIFSALQVKLNFSTAYHPESDGQTERVNQCLEQYLRTMAFKEPHKWANWLPTAEWWYNSSYHTSLKCTPFEALYGYPPPQINTIPLPCDVSPEATVTIQEKDNMLKSL